MERFEGGVEFLEQIDVHYLTKWIKVIPLWEWPQQNGPGKPLKPAMVTDLDWHYFGAQVMPLVDYLTAPGTESHQWMLSCVMPGETIPPHKDEQAPNWLYRVHVPLITNPQSKFIVDNTEHQLEVGNVYKVNTLKEHSVINEGAGPRIHFMFDLRKK